jgi:hypothetical protein
MPNSNPSGANQPLNQHPRWVNGLHELAQDAQLLPGPLTALSGDVLLIGPPVTGGVRRLVDPADITLFLSASGGAGSTDVAIVYKDGSGNEIVLASRNLADSAAGATARVQVDIFLVPSDLGIFLRVTASTAVGLLSALAKWADVRGVSRQDTVLTTSWQTVAPAAPVGSIVVPAPGFTGEPVGDIYNYDGILHAVSFRFTDGVNVIEPAALAVPVAVGGRFNELGLIQSFYPLPPGASLQAQLAAAPGAPVVASLPVILTNQGPVRQDQGGAY